MAIPSVDVKFLQAIVKGMKADQMVSYVHGKNRSAQAIVLRFSGDDGIKTARCFSHLDRNLTANQTITRLTNNMDIDAPSSLTMFLLKRADVDSARWSGQIAFPGGRRDYEDDVDDRATAEREAYDQVGFPLGISHEFVFLGKIPDVEIQTKEIHTEGLIMSRYVYLHIGEMTPSVNFSKYQVESTQWVPLAQLHPSKLQWDKVQHPIETFVHYTWLERRQMLRDIQPNTRVMFPSLPMPQGWHLWGQCLGGVSKLLEYDGRPRVDFPYFRVSSIMMQWLVVHPYHGYLNIMKGERPIYFDHIFCFAVWVFVIWSFIQSVYLFLRAFRAAFEVALAFKRKHTSAVFEKALMSEGSSATFIYPEKAPETFENEVKVLRGVMARPGIVNPYKPQGPEISPEMKFKTTDPHLLQYTAESFWSKKADPTMPGEETDSSSSSSSTSTSMSRTSRFSLDNVFDLKRRKQKEADDAAAVQEQLLTAVDGLVMESVTAHGAAEQRRQKFVYAPPPPPPPPPSSVVSSSVDDIAAVGVNEEETVGSVPAAIPAQGSSVSASPVTPTPTLPAALADPIAVTATAIADASPAVGGDEAKASA